MIDASEEGVGLWRTPGITGLTPTRYVGGCQPHPFNRRHAGALYRATMRREQELRNLGYTVVTMWEMDYLQRLLERGTGKRSTRFVMGTSWQTWKNKDRYVLGGASQ